MMAFKKGDLVKLKSGGPVMTVDHIGTDGVGCVWFEATTLKEGLFSAETLVLSKSDSTKSMTKVTKSPFAIALDSSGDKTMEAILLHVDTLGDDKDEEMFWEIAIQDASGKRIGQLDTPHSGDKWDNNTSRDIRIAVAATPFEDRLNYSLYINQHNREPGNRKWEGVLEAKAEVQAVGGPELPEVLRRTDYLKIGDGYPTERTFAFDE